MRFGTKCPIGTFLRILSAENVGVPGVSVGDVFVPSVLLRDKKDDFGESRSIKDERLGLRLPRSEGDNNGVRCGDDIVNLSPSPTGDFSLFVGLLESIDVIDVSKNSRDDESNPKCVRFISSLSWSTITVERLLSIFGLKRRDTPLSTTSASSLSSLSSLLRISSSSKNVLSDTALSSSSIVSLAMSFLSKTTFPVHTSSIISSGVRLTCVRTPHTTAGATSLT